MFSTTSIVILLGIIAFATVLGFTCARNGFRVIRRTPGTVSTVTPKNVGLKSNQALGERATLIQFSTPYCAKCPATASLLSTVADGLEGVQHVEVDLSQHLAVARRFNVLQTPTTLIVDAEGTVRATITGAPALHVVQDELEAVLTPETQQVRSGHLNQDRMASH